MGQIEPIKTGIVQGDRDVIKNSADQTVNNSTTLVNATNLKKTLGSSEVYAFDCLIKVLGFAASDIKLGFTAPAGAVVFWGVDDSALDKTISDSVTVSLTNSVVKLIRIRGIVINSTTAGDLQLQFAQATAVAEDTTIQENSIILIDRVDADTADPSEISTLNDIPNVNITTISDDEIIQYDSASAKWINRTLAEIASEIKTAYENNADTNAFTDADETKLDGIEAGADVTDATNVDAAGATMNTDSDVSSNSYVLDEDNMASDSATKVPTQQSVKAYADTMLPKAGGTMTGDIDVGSQDLINVNKTQNKVETITSSATIAIDMSTEDVAEIDTLAHAPTFTTTNRAVGRKKIIHITCDGSARALTFSESWRWRTAVPTTTVASKHSTLSLECVHGTATTDIVASWVEQP